MWLVEKYGRVFARLEDPRFEDMFWYIYRVSDLTSTDADRALLFSEAFWHESPLPQFRHEQSGSLCTTALVGGVTPIPDDPCVTIRSLDLLPDKRGWPARLAGFLSSALRRLIR